MRFLAQAKHIGKVVLINQAPVSIRPTLPDQPTISPDATYLITGGLGGVGLLTARWLADRGARSIALVSRSSPSLEAASYIGELRDAGVHVEVLAADVSKPAETERVLGFLRANLPPLRGIVHAAMVLDDTPLAELDEACMTRAMAPKVQGAWNLHRQTLDHKLDFFVMFSSIASLLGNPSQANYAAANAFLDSFAAYRRAKGLPATTINWGVIAGSGYVARHEEIEDYLHRQGYQSFTEKQVVEVLSEVLRHDAVQIMAARIDWRRLADFGPRAAASPRLRDLVPAVPGGPVQAWRSVDDGRPSESASSSSSRAYGTVHPRTGSAATWRVGRHRRSTASHHRSRSRFADCLRVGRCSGTRPQRATRWNQAVERYQHPRTRGPTPSDCFISRPPLQRPLSLRSNPHPFKQRRSPSTTPRSSIKHGRPHSNACAPSPGPAFASSATSKRKASKTSRRSAPASWP